MFDPFSQSTHGWIRSKYDDIAERRLFAPKDAKIGRGPRLIIMAAGGEMGFVEEVTEVIPVSKAKANVDYHQNVNFEKFSEWMSRLLDAADKNRPKKTVIVMDNCPFHSSSSAPQAKSRVGVIKSWLQKKKDEGIAVPDGFMELKKADLLGVLRDVKKLSPDYKLDDMVISRGHEILRLSPYSPDLNPIELIWAQFKNRLRRINRSQNIKEVHEQAKSVLSQITSVEWRKVIAHVIKIEEEYLKSMANLRIMTQSEPEIELVMNQEDQQPEDDTSGLCQSSLNMNDVETDTDDE